MAVHRPVGGVVGPVKAFEQARLFGRRNADALIADR